MFELLNKKVESVASWLKILAGFYDEIMFFVSQKWQKYCALSLTVYTSCKYVILPYLTHMQCNMSLKGRVSG